MIPPFDDSGCLPPGVYLATLDEIEERFGTHSEERRAQMESVRWMVDLAVRAGVERIVLNGSFTTDIIEPKDVDCILLFTPVVGRDPAAIEELEAGLPYLDIAVGDQADFDEFVNVIFAAGRFANAKGMVEIDLWS